MTALDDLCREVLDLTTEVQDLCNRLLHTDTLGE